MAQGLTSVDLQHPRFRHVDISGAILVQLFKKLFDIRVHLGHRQDGRGLIFVYVCVSVCVRARESSCACECVRMCMCLAAHKW